MAGHLRIGRGHRVDFQGGRGEWARFVPVDLAGGFTALKSLGHANAGNTIFLALAATSVASQSTSLTSASTIGDRSAFEVLLQEEQLQRADPPPMFPLSFAHKEALMSTGYLLLPGLVPTPQVEAALRAINAHLGLGAAAWSEEEGRPALAGGIKSARPIMYLLYATAAFGYVHPADQSQKLSLSPACQDSTQDHFVVQPPQAPTCIFVQGCALKLVQLQIVTLSSVTHTLLRACDKHDARS